MSKRLDLSQSDMIKAPIIDFHHWHNKVLSEALRAQASEDAKDAEIIILRKRVEELEYAIPSRAGGRDE